MLKMDAKKSLLVLRIVAMGSVLRMSKLDRNMSKLARNSISGMNGIMRMNKQNKGLCVS